MNLLDVDDKQSASCCKNVEDLMAEIRRNVIGGEEVIKGPWGKVPLVYADYTASGRLLSFVENFMQKVVYPVYANTHTDASYCGARINTMYRQARDIILESFNVNKEDFAVLFTGSGCTGAIHKMVQILSLNDCQKQNKKTWDRPVVFIGPYEHHSNEVIWRESDCDVVVIPENDQGTPDLEYLSSKLKRYKYRTLKIGSFSAGSNVTGIVTDTDAIANLLHAHNALAFFDYAGTGPYVPINASNKDAIFLSPHKFIGGPGSSGVLVFRRSIYARSTPSIPGGGTVSFVTPTKHWYIEDIEAREDGGTPAILQAIRAALAIRFKSLVGDSLILQQEEHMIQKFFDTLGSSDLNIKLIGGNRPTYWKFPRVSIFSFLIPYKDPSHPQYKALHHNFVAALLNDLYGIQSRAGCFCAGPYGHRLFETVFGNVDFISKASRKLVVNEGLESLKWGWVRVNLNYFVCEEEADYILQAIKQIAENGWKLLPFYTVDAQTGIWQHKDHNENHNDFQKLDLFDFGKAPVCTEEPQERPSYQQALQNAQNVYDSINDDQLISLCERFSQESITNNHNYALFQKENVNQLRWFPLPHEGMELLSGNSKVNQVNSIKFTQLNNMDRDNNNSNTRKQVNTKGAQNSNYVRKTKTSRFSVFSCYKVPKAQ
eukprot:TRINITY_DN1069_c0_g1_i1.p1 TRINITY_DN1069_c0_g1~~TRINITY_DN1069_c0_g1_i1.p1  ORF type:complete len:657 (-),score=49.49 TRINITY_DN1069_c0_g1_i1:334-2304(-)